VEQFRHLHAAVGVAAHSLSWGALWCCLWCGRSWGSLGGSGWESSLGWEREAGWETLGWGWETLWWGTAAQLIADIRKLCEALKVLNVRWLW
jgi:hypothetical protein